MQIQLPPEALAGIAHELAVRSHLRGPEILGSQLGKIVNDALRPYHIRDFGGLRSFAQTFLAEHVRIKPVEGGEDLVYEVVAAAPPAMRPTNVPQDFEPVAGADLWRFFSNPNIACQLAVQLPSTVVVGPPDRPLPEHSTALARISALEYRALADQFLQEHSDNLEVVAALQAALNIEDFYKPWISALRRLRSTVDLLKSWEILRTSTVATALSQALGKAGVDASRAAEIVQIASPVPKSARVSAQITSLQVTAAAVEKPFSFNSLKKPVFYGGGEALSLEDDTTELRQFIHRAIDQMSAAELKEIRISAGTLMKVSVLKPRA